jgi:hypothetical protein
MMRTMLGRRRRTVAALAVLTFAASACGGGSDSTTSRQDQVEARGATVMPFDQRRTTHVFHSTTTGGVQRVIAKDAGDAKQITLVRRHLRKEAARFGAGDFSDPMAIHGMTMPGLDALRRGAARVGVTYSTIARGAQITYTTAEPGLVTALHDWFDAQLMDHGSNAHG